jgi:hypothetical protein
VNTRSPSYSKSTECQFGENIVLASILCVNCGILCRDVFESRGQTKESLFILCVFTVEKSYIKPISSNCSLDQYLCCMPRRQLLHKATYTLKPTFNATSFKAAGNSEFISRYTFRNGDSFNSCWTTNRRGC